MGISQQESQKRPVLWAWADEGGRTQAGMLMACLFVSSQGGLLGRRVASLDVDGVIKVWSFNPIMQTKASSISSHHCSL